MKHHSQKIFYGFVAVLLALRLFHLGPELDLPHDWRQADTAYYIYDFYQNGIDLFYPAVCWMGGYETVVFEFPLPEAIVALVMQLSGESMLVMRLVFVLFFCLAAYFLYRSLALVFGQHLARWAILVYLALPLSFYYSRAIHIDFFALACAYAMLYYYLKAVKKRDWILLFVSSLLAIPAFLVKAPYAVFLALPMLVYAWQQKALYWLLPRAFYFLLPIVVFGYWQYHVYTVNGQAPDWQYILNYRKFDNNAHWYYGTLQQRLSLYLWKVLSLRVVLEVAGLAGTVFLLLGLVKIKRITKVEFIWAWIIGLAIYLLIFFNLNVVHNYYQLPFLAVAALLAANALLLLSEKKKGWGYIGLLLLVSTNWLYSEKTYYQVPVELVEIGQHIHQQTPEDALLIMTYKNFDCKNPRILYRAKRRGWSIEEAALNKTVLQKLVEEEKATHWVYIGPSLPDVELPGDRFLSVEKQKLEMSTDSLFIIEWKQ